MDIQLFELKISMKDLLKNLIDRIEPICISIEKREDFARLTYWLEDLSILTETTLVLYNNEIIDVDITLFNEKVEMLLDKVEEKDYSFIADLLQFEIKPLFSYWDECITND
ncbi:hypothetical protein [Metabacillus halosaccharovorans]|uniref:Uncharacterized protein n=1 Tax=Metabacillus halosaccharovorans TaxID=930124 RepID=A0ABT3DC90_9BACI|nr:hypothetical protein [Metabacillus halosaccharovorans]MCV9884674.1 hypothetical protein [Metabacillus halosaccharovorans]